MRAMSFSYWNGLPFYELALFFTPLICIFTTLSPSITWVSNDLHDLTGLFSAFDNVNVVVSSGQGVRGGLSGRAMSGRNYPFFGNDGACAVVRSAAHVDNEWKSS